MRRSRTGSVSRKSKYGNTPTVVLNEAGERLRFDSAAEARYYATLQWRVKTGELSRVERQVVFPLYAWDGGGGRHLICRYRADFVLYYADGRPREVVDVKGVETPEFKLKKKLFEVCYAERIVLVRAT